MLHAKHWRNKVQSIATINLFIYKIKAYIYDLDEISKLFSKHEFKDCLNLLENNLFSRLLPSEPESSHYQSTYSVSEQPPGHHLQNQLQRISEL